MKTIEKQSNPSFNIFKNFITKLFSEELKLFMGENKITDIDEWCKPILSFEQYLIVVGSRIEDTVTIPVEEISLHIEHFKDCYNRGISPYKSLLLI